MHIKIFMHDGEKSECWQGPHDSAAWVVACEPPVAHP